MKTINIKSDDFLWRSYVNFFAIKGKPLVQPKNLCPYFWVALAGLCLTVVEAASKALILLLTATAVVLLLMVATGDAISFAEKGGYPGIVVWSLNLALLVFALLSLFAWLLLCTATVYRARKELRKRPKLMNGLLGLWVAILGAVFVTAAVKDSTFRSELAHFGFGLICVLVGILAAVFAAALGFPKLAKIFPSLPIRLRALAARLGPLGHRLARLCQTIDAYVIARSERICPPVAPPQGSGAIDSGESLSGSA